MVFWGLSQRKWFLGVYRTENDFDGFATRKMAFRDLPQRIWVLGVATKKMVSRDLPHWKCFLQFCQLPHGKWVLGVCHIENGF